MADSRLVCLLFGLLLQNAVVLTQGKKAKCKDFKQYATDHTACNTVDNTVRKDGGITAQHKKEIVDYHNLMRSQVDPPAADMLKMVWDDEIADIAWKWAKQCSPRSTPHDKNHQRLIPNRYALGQNRAGRWGALNWTLAMKMWGDEEKPNFKYGGGSSEKKQWQHYTQMVWAASNKIGCGHAYCKAPDGGEYVLYICNYGPAGNAANKLETPYVKGSTMGSSCKKKKTNQGLCDCRRKECHNNGKMNVKTCKCECPAGKTWLKKGKCSFDCPATEEGPQCLWLPGIFPNYCHEFTADLADCPVTCNLC